MIQNAARKQQIIDFRNLRYGDITPTDVDAAIEYKNKAWIVIEYKYGGAELPYGQRLALERLIKDAEAAGKEAIAIVAEHCVHDTTESIQGDSCKVREICYKQGYKWRRPRFNCTVKQILDKFVEFVDRDMKL